MHPYRKNFIAYEKVCFEWLCVLRTLYHTKENIFAKMSYNLLALLPPPSAFCYPPFPPFFKYDPCHFLWVYRFEAFFSPVLAWTGEVRLWMQCWFMFGKTRLRSGIREVAYGKPKFAEATLYQIWLEMVEMVSYMFYYPSFALFQEWPIPFSLGLQSKHIFLQMYVFQEFFFQVLA